MPSSRWIPESGDLVWLQLSPSVGREQSGHRPAVVVSRRQFTARTGFAMICPITRSVRHYPMNVVISQESPPSGSGKVPIWGEILVAHLRSVDIDGRGFQSAEERLDPALLAELLTKLTAIFPF